MQQKREPVARKPAAPSSANATNKPFIPGYEGRRYGVCDDKAWHLILKIHDCGMTDVLCSENVRVVQPQPPTESSDFPMCKLCVNLHFENTSKC